MGTTPEASLERLRSVAARVDASLTDPEGYRGAHEEDLERAVSELGAPTAETSEAVVSTLVDLAVTATGASATRMAARILDLVLRFALDDPHRYCLRANGLRAIDVAEVDEAHRDAFVALASRRDAIAAVAAAPPPATSDPEACDERAPAAFFRGARLALALIDGAPEEEASAWARAFDLLWGDAAIAASGSDPPLVRGAAAIADAARAGGDGSALASLVDRRERSWADPWAPVGLFAELGEPAGVALISPSAARMMDRPRAAAIVRALLRLLDRFDDVHHRRATLAGNLVCVAFAARAPLWPEGHRHLTIPLASSLDALEREVLTTIAEKVSPFQWQFEVHHALFAVSLPATWDGLRRWLGMDPPSAMEAEVSVRIGREACALGVGLAFGRLLAGELEERELAHAMARDLPLATLLDLADGGLQPFDYRLHCTGPSRTEAECLGVVVPVLVLALETRGLAAIHDALVAEADRRIVHERGIDPHPSAILVALSRSFAARGEVLPVRFDLLVTKLMTDAQTDLATAHALLAALPEARRDALVLHVRRAVSLGPKPDYDDCLSPAARAALVDDPGSTRRVAALAEHFAELAREVTR